jgi:hypothetical protein
MGCKYRKIIRIMKKVIVKDEENDDGCRILVDGFTHKRSGREISRGRPHMLQ